jgi:hypothetical protein
MIAQHAGKDADNLIRLWEQIGEGEVTDIAEYAAKHLKRTSKPLRIAVNEAYWRYNNLVRAGKSFLIPRSLRF